MSENAKHVKAGDNDVFIRNKVYPDASAIFTTAPAPIDDVQKDCDVVLDTNALLIPYTVGRDTLSQVEKTYLQLVSQKRLHIPGQVAREFADNRAKKIGEIFQQLTRKRNGLQQLQSGNYPLLEGIPAYQESISTEKAVDELQSKYREQLGKVLSVIKGWTWDDPVSVMYKRLFKDGVVWDPQLDEKTILDDLRHRQAHSRPPGYKDKAKDDEGIGDLLIWKAIIGIGSSKKRHLLFVSGDEKADWWHQSEKQPLYPRFELFNEYARVSNGSTFQIVLFSRFLEMFGAGKGIVDEVKQEEEISKVPAEANVGLREALDAAQVYAIALWPDAMIRHSLDFPDFRMIHPDNRVTGIDVKVVKNPKSLARRIDETSWRAADWLEGRPERRFLQILVVPRSAKTVSHTLVRKLLLQRKVTVVVGYIEGGVFIPHAGWK